MNYKDFQKIDEIVKSGRIMTDWEWAKFIFEQIGKKMVGKKTIGKFGAFVYEILNDNLGISKNQIGDMYESIVGKINTLVNELKTKKRDYYYNKFLIASREYYTLQSEINVMTEIEKIKNDKGVDSYFKLIKTLKNISNKYFQTIKYDVKMTIMKENKAKEELKIEMMA